MAVVALQKRFSFSEETKEVFMGIYTNCNHRNDNQFEIKITKGISRALVYLKGNIASPQKSVDKL
jgi:hypothetical protein